VRSGPIRSLIIRIVSSLLFLASVEHSRHTDMASRCVVAASAQVLAIIKDRVPGTASETVCGGQSRQRHVMLSESHDVDVRMVLQSRRDEPGRYVLLRYEGTPTSYSYLPFQRLVFLNVKAFIY